MRLVVQLHDRAATWGSYAAAVQDLDVERGEDGLGDVRPHPPGAMRGGRPRHTFGLVVTQPYSGEVFVMPVARCHPTAAVVARWENDDDA